MSESMTSRVPKSLNGVSRRQLLGTTGLVGLGSLLPA